MQIQLKPSEGKPIYRQIVDSIQNQIKSGTLEEGERLPTVRDLATKMGIARGTIKHAYDELEKQGAIEMTQGKGTFVANNSDQQLLSRKERAMHAIDIMLDELEQLSFSNRDIEIFLQLKLRERDTFEPVVKVAIVDCNPETLSIIARQISRVDEVEVYQLLLEDLLKNPYAIGEDVDLVVTTSTHISQIEKFVAEQGKTAPVVLAPAQKTIVELAKLAEGAKIHVMSASYRFFEIVKNGCIQTNGQLSKLENIIFGEREVTEGLLSGADALILPPDYLLYCTGAEEKAIRTFAMEKPVIYYEYQIDDGSMMYLGNRIKRIHQEKVR